ncbi:MAG: NAD(P)-dependent oxidoreductase [Patescibacteria group bacterium]
MANHKVIFTGCPFSDETIRFLWDSGIEIIKQPDNLSEEELIKALSEGIEGYVLGGYEIATQKVIESTSSLKIMSFLGAGYENYLDVKAATSKGIAVTNTPGANAQSVAEFTVALILNTVKQISELNKNIKEDHWKPQQLWDLKGKTVGIIGFGHIGKKVAEILEKGFGMKILHYSRTSENSTPLDKLLSDSDIVTIHIPLNSESTNLISAEKLKLMKQGAILINTSRPQIVDGHALYESLVNNKIACAAFDGYYQEPLISVEKDEFKLSSLPNSKFILTPHNAYNSSDAMLKMGEMIIESLTDFFSGKTPRYKVN